MPRPLTLRRNVIRVVGPFLFLTKNSWRGWVSHSTIVCRVLCNDLTSQPLLRIVKNGEHGSTSLNSRLPIYFSVLCDKVMASTRGHLRSAKAASLCVNINCYRLNNAVFYGIRAGLWLTMALTFRNEQWFAMDKERVYVSKLQ